MNKKDSLGRITFVTNLFFYGIIFSLVSIFAAALILNCFIPDAKLTKTAVLLTAAFLDLVFLFFMGKHLYRQIFQTRRQYRKHLRKEYAKQQSTVLYLLGALILEAVFFAVAPKGRTSFTLGFYLPLLLSVFAVAGGILYPMPLMRGIRSPRVLILIELIALAGIFVGQILLLTI